MNPKPIIAILYDFDKTLCTKDMQEYSFISKVNMKPEDFWAEVGTLANREEMDSILAYMYWMLRKANAADHPIRREDFVKLGEDLEYFPGVPEWFARMNRFAEEIGVTLEHYIISSGLLEVIEGSRIYHEFHKVFACEFLYDANGVACWPKNAVNYTTKTQFLFRINKGILDISKVKELNHYMPEDSRRIPFRNMIYIGDGLTDVPCMKLVKVNGGKSIAVYQEGTRGTAEELIHEDRVDLIAAADYRENQELDLLVRDIIWQMAIGDKLVRKGMEQRG